MHQVNLQSEIDRFKKQNGHLPCHVIIVLADEFGTVDVSTFPDERQYDDPHINLCSAATSILANRYYGQQSRIEQAWRYQAEQAGRKLVENQVVKIEKQWDRAQTRAYHWLDKWISPILVFLWNNFETIVYALITLTFVFVFAHVIH